MILNKKHNKLHNKFKGKLSFLQLVFFGFMLISFLSFLLSGCAEMEPNTIHHLKVQVRNLNKKVSNLSANTGNYEQKIHNIHLNIANQGVKIVSVKSKLNDLIGKYEVISHNLRVLEKKFRNYRLIVNKELVKLLKKEKMQPVVPITKKPVSKKISSSKVSIISKKQIALKTKQLPLEMELKKYKTAESLYKKGLYSKALTGFKNYLNKYPESKYSPYAYYYKAVCNFRLKNYPVSILEFHKFTRLYPKNKHIPMAIYLQGMGFFKLSDPSDASILFRQVAAKYGSTKAGKLSEEALKKQSK